jgi:isocitrate lyase
MKRLALVLATACALCAPPLQAQQAAKLVIADGASYDLSLRCYQYYDVEGQIAAARAARAQAGTPQAEELGKRVTVVKVVKNAWNLNIDKTKGDRKKGDVDKELESAGQPIVADANAGLGGDADAKARMEALHAECKAQETATGG